MAHDRPRPVLGTGVPEIDAGHEGLSFLLGRLFDAGVECRRRDGGCDHTDCRKIGALATYLGRNFAAEEALMERGSYPPGDEHCRDHLRLIEELREMQAARMCGERDRAIVRHSVDRWAARHHHGADHPLARWAVTRRLLPAAE